jgi:ankyrin repeat protein
VRKNTGGLIFFSLAFIFIAIGVTAQDNRLLTAIKNDDAVAVGKLAARKSVNAIDEDGDPLLHNAALYASAGVMESLLKKGADPNAKNKEGETALMWCTYDPDKMKLLVKYGADVNAIATSGNSALLVAAVGANQYETVKFLLEHGADAAVRNKRKETAMIRAAIYGDSLTLALLHKHGNDLNAMDSTGATPLLQAVFNVNRQATLWLLNNGADADKVGAFQLTALSGVVTFNDLPSVKAVLDRARNINTVDELGISALMWAVYNEHDNPDIIQLLLDRGADVNIRAKNGDSALSWALKKGNTKTVALLKKAGAQ